MKKIIFAVGLLCLCSAFFNYAGGSDKDTQSQKPSWTVQPKHGKKEYHKHSILVKFKKGVLKHHRTAVAKLVNGRYQDRNQDGIDDRYHRILDGRWVLIEFKEEQDVDLATKAINVLKKHRHVEHVEYNYKQYILKTPNDPRYNKLWGMKKIAAEKVWGSTTGRPDVIVGVIDTGVDYNHQDLAGNMWVNPNEIPHNGIDDEGNGYVDDVRGINAITGSGNPMDDESHGTHCAGTIGAVGNNNLGVVGVNWTVKIAAMKFLNSKGKGLTSDAVTCINYAIDLKRKWKQNLRVLSNSWGSYSYSQALHDAIRDANNADILFVASAGNSGQNTDEFPLYPACCDVPNVMSVAATEQDDGLRPSSNYGAATVDLGAPGSNILSTVPHNSYAYKSGTSMATAHVSGVAALLLSMKGKLTVQDLKTNLMNYGDPAAALQGKTVSGRRLNAYYDFVEKVPLKYGQYVHIQNGYDNWASYLDLCNPASCPKNKYNVSTAVRINRDGGSGTWEIISASGKAVGRPVLVGDSVYLKNKYKSGSYLDACGRTSCGGNVYRVSTSSNPDRFGSSTWEIISAPGKAVGSPVLTWDRVHLMNKNSIGSSYLDVCGGAACKDTVYNVSTSYNKDRKSGSGTWRFVDIPPLKYGQYVHIQNGYDNWASYLDVCGGAAFCSNVYNVSTSSSTNRESDSGTWEIISAYGEAVGRPVLFGDSVHLRNKYTPGSGSYLDICNPASCPKNMYNVSTSWKKNRDRGSGTWVIISASGKPISTPVMPWDSVHLWNQYDTGSYLDTCGHTSCGGNLYPVSTSAKPNRDRGSGIWRFIDMY